MHLIYSHPICTVVAGQGYFETRSDGGDCYVDATEDFGARRLKSTNANFGLHIEQPEQGLAIYLRTHLASCCHSLISS